MARSYQLQERIPRALSVEVAGNIVKRGTARAPYSSQQRSRRARGPCTRAKPPGTLPLQPLQPLDTSGHAKGSDRASSTRRAVAQKRVITLQPLLTTSLRLNFSRDGSLTRISTICCTTDASTSLRRLVTDCTPQRFSKPLQLLARPNPFASEAITVSFTARRRKTPYAVCMRLARPKTTR